MDLSYPPFEMINEHGDPDGISVALATALSNDLHRPLEIENIPFSGLLPSLQADKIDLIISSMTDTPERRQSIAFSDPYVTLRLGILMPFPSMIHSLEDLDKPGVILAVRQGTTGQLWAKNNLKQTKIIIFEDEATAVLEVLQKKVDAFLYDEMSIWRHHQQHLDQTMAFFSSLQKESWAIALRSNDDELRQQVNLFLKHFRQEKGFERLGDQYLREQKEFFHQQGIPFLF